MVYAFALGVTLGLPLGCYLRETGLARKLQSAYGLFVAPPDTHSSEKYKNKSEQFYKNIKKGQVDPTQFERYVYGGSYAQRTSDEVDKIESEVNQQMKELKYEGR
ncbi:hypothetical protein FGO68_gene3592 [Halteria grandinella]|uniref:Uncharacterized protein n=1 Tax=Halteria grandinella TaxID=5974 RepID=A0A8J8NDC1_HALGN|nr:hypothetical protein FGO68_gene3592 [Halteria grandinella]